MTFSIHMANIVFHDKPVESNGEAEEIRNDPTSSPHSWGTLVSVFPRKVHPGIIPAFAGNTQHILMAVCQSQDHPRIRGEHKPRIVSSSIRLGSSPHSRGTLNRNDECCRLHRIIPAFAGNTDAADDHLPRVQDHPRIRGEHLSHAVRYSSVRGSSPHSRGTRTLIVPEPTENGIIPAFAGNTPPAQACRGAMWDHPRIRGEHHGYQQRQLSRRGSSPHSRGTQVII